MSVYLYVTEGRVVMKKIAVIVAGIVVFVLLAGGCFLLYGIFHSPEYALKQTIEDVNESGLEGLQSHLTGNASEIIGGVSAVADNNLLSYVYSLADLDEYAAILMSEMSEVEWSVEDIMKGKKNAEAMISFRYKDYFSGSLSIDMVWEDGEWKIDNLSDLSVDGLL